MLNDGVHIGAGAAGQAAATCTSPSACRQASTTTKLYEEARFRAAAGAQLRPGGLKLTQELAGLCGLRPGERVLDVGCGVGSTASFLVKRWGVECVGLDSSAGFVAEASAYDSGVSWVVGRAQSIPYPDRHFDAVFSECFLSTLGDPVQVLREIRRVLRPGGRLAVTDVYLRRPEALSSLPGSLAAGTCLSGAVGEGATRALVEQAGFTVQIWRDRSEALKTLVAALIFAYGSTGAVREALMGSDRELWESVTGAKPGYYLMVAEPRSGPT